MLLNRVKAKQKPYGFKETKIKIEIKMTQSSAKILLKWQIKGN